MAQKNNPRKCIVTQKMMQKDKLIRVVKTKQGEILIDSDAQGRGAYISKTAPIDQIIKGRVLDRTFRVKTSKDVYDKLITILKGE